MEGSTHALYASQSDLLFEIQMRVIVINIIIRPNYKLHHLTLVKVQFSLLSFESVNSVLQLSIGFNSVFPFDSVSLTFTVNFYFLFSLVSLIKISRKLIKTQKN